VGEVRLVTGDQQQALSAGDLVPIPPVRHALEADTDAAVLLTVALGGGAAGEHH
jgi:quercetin dioxygenase-like cupin family protein